MSSPRKLTRSGTRGYAHLVEVAVPAARVWRALTDPALVRIWSGQEAEIDAREGGVYRIGRHHAGGREAHIDVFDVNRRLRLIYLKGPDTPRGDSAVVDDFLLDVRKSEGVTSLRLLGSGIPESESWDASYVKFRLGWERLMGRIKVTLESPPKPKPVKATEPPKDPPLPGLDY
ncbi:MAG TPA: SRPBCC domain-containing protein [Steroidobacteraceae bacterium]|nr:SRPBCC domain-containing protein [Steroidobacteraceae bacterium]